MGKLVVGGHVLIAKTLATAVSAGAVTDFQRASVRRRKVGDRIVESFGYELLLPLHEETVCLSVGEARAYGIGFICGSRAGLGLPLAPGAMFDGTDETSLLVLEVLLALGSETRESREERAEERARALGIAVPILRAPLYPKVRGNG